MTDETHAERWEHGTGYAYRWKDCRCPKCQYWFWDKQRADLKAFDTASSEFHAAYKTWEDAKYGAPVTVVAGETPRERRNRLTRNVYRLRKARAALVVAAEATGRPAPD